jgi:hypothetical protein
MATKSKLDLLSVEFRDKLLAKNAYNNAAPSNNYSGDHTKALSDSVTPVKGKGTGIFLDTYNGGGDMDINGNPEFPGSGRKAALAMNQGKWGYSPDSPYETPIID